MAFFSIKKKSLILCMLACGLSAYAQNQDSLKTTPPPQEEEHPALSRPTHPLTYSRLLEVSFEGPVAMTGPSTML